MNKKIFLKSSYKCPQCGYEVFVQNENKDGIVIKSKLTFISEDGNLMCRCKQCKNVIGLPMQIIDFNILKITDKKEDVSI